MFMASMPALTTAALILRAVENFSMLRAPQS
jgi:hypothetical protein